jgi:hypothetical protein
MSEERWVVTHATEHGATRMWCVDGTTAETLFNVMNGSVHANGQPVAFRTNDGAALIWLTPGQSLTVERSNG